MLILHSLPSTAYAQATNDDQPGGQDVRPIVRAELTTGEVKTTGFWISQPGLALLVAEVEARGKSNVVRQRALEMHRQARPDTAKPARAFVIGLGAGFTLGVTLTGVFVLLL